MTVALATFLKIIIGKQDEQRSTWMDRGTKCLEDYPEKPKGGSGRGLWAAQVRARASSHTPRPQGSSHKGLASADLQAPEHGPGWPDRGVLSQPPGAAPVDVVHKRTPPPSWWRPELGTE